MDIFSSDLNIADESQGIFTIKGQLDGEIIEEFSDKEQLIGLTIGEEVFLLPISAVNEIIMLEPITYVPRSPLYVEGVLNLRGHILPAINLRKMMGIEKGSVTPSTRIVIASDGKISIGMLVDSITTVFSLLPNEIENRSLPTRNPDLDTDIISRICKTEDEIIGILDISKILGVMEAKNKDEAA